jgi:hypothetical protein
VGCRVEDYDELWAQHLHLPLKCSSNVSAARDRLRRMPYPAPGPLSGAHSFFRVTFMKRRRCN